MERTGGGGARFKRPFPPSLGPEDCTLVTYQLVLRAVRFDANHLSANPWEGAPSATGGRPRFARKVSLSGGCQSLSKRKELNKRDATRVQC